MRQRNTILVTTTDLLDGLKIKKYIDTVSAHIVTGTGVFSDFAAGLSDIFGGRSNTYQKQLNSIKNEVLDMLKNEAKKLGANAIIGLTIDFDEVSGKGKTMFMVTAMGTAVLLEDSIAESKIEGNNILSADEMKLEIDKNYCLEKAAKDELKLNEDIWKFLIENRVEELGDYLLEKIDKMTSSGTSNSEWLEMTARFAKDYFSSINQDTAKNYLYKAVRSKNDFLNKLAGEVICELDLVDTDEILSLLDSCELIHKKKAINLLKYSKQSYFKEDIIKYQAIRDKLKNCFSETGERFSKKQMLSSKENEYWKCSCGGKNLLDEYCENCGKDIYGFTRDEHTPVDGIRFTESKIIILKKYFETGN